MQRIPQLADTGPHNGNAAVIGRLRIKMGTAIVGGSAFRLDHLAENYIHHRSATVWRIRRRKVYESS